MSKFPGISLEYLEWKCSYAEMLLWFDRALEIHTGEYEDEADVSVPDIDDEMEYRDGRWVCRTPDK